MGISRSTGRPCRRCSMSSGPATSRGSSRSTRPTSWIRPHAAVADGRRGRRWREVVATGDAVQHSLLLETSPDGRFSHLELARAGGLWTFHPEGNGSLHGNAVDRDRPEVRHVVGWPFAPDDVMLVEGSPLSAAAIAWHAAAEAPNVITDRRGVILRVNGEI